MPLFSCDGPLKLPWFMEWDGGEARDTPHASEHAPHPWTPHGVTVTDPSPLTETVR